MLPLTLAAAMLAADPVMTTAAGTGAKGYSGDGGPATEARLNGPFAVCLDKARNVLFSDTFNHCVRRVDAGTKIITTVAGNGARGYSGDGGPASEAQLNEPYGVLSDPATGHLYIVDRLNFCVRKVDGATGVITTVAGTGKSGYSGDGGPANKAMMVEPNGIALDGKGRLYIADVRGQRVRVVDLAKGTIATFAGTGEKKSGGEGPAAKTALLGPRAVAVSPNGYYLYICLREGNAVLRADLSGEHRVRAFAGTGQKGYSGDGGPAAGATFNGPKELAVDASGNLFVVDTENHAVRRIDAKTGVVTTVAGDGKPGPGGDGGPATKARLGRPHGAWVAPDGTVYIGDTENHRVRAVRPR